MDELSKARKSVVTSLQNILVKRLDDCRGLVICSSIGMEHLEIPKPCKDSCLLICGCGSMGVETSNLHDQVIAIPQRIAVLDVLGIMDRMDEKTAFVLKMTQDMEEIRKMFFHLATTQIEVVTPKNISPKKFPKKNSLVFRPNKMIRR